MLLEQRPWKTDESVSDGRAPRESTWFSLCQLQGQGVPGLVHRCECVEETGPVWEWEGAYTSAWGDVGKCTDLSVHVRNHRCGHVGGVCVHSGPWACLYIGVYSFSPAWKQIQRKTLLCTHTHSRTHIPNELPSWAPRTPLLGRHFGTTLESNAHPGRAQGQLHYPSTR